MRERGAPRLACGGEGRARRCSQAVWMRNCSSRGPGMSPGSGWAGQRQTGWCCSTPGEIARVKRVDLARAAVTAARREIPDLRWEVLDGSTPPEDMVTLMNASDCLLLTSDYEGSPAVVQEALATQSADRQRGCRGCAGTARRRAAHARRRAQDPTRWVGHLSTRCACRRGRMGVRHVEVVSFTEISSICLRSTGRPCGAGD